MTLDDIKDYVIPDNFGTEMRELPDWYWSKGIIFAYENDKELWKPYIQKAMEQLCNDDYGYFYEAGENPIYLCESPFGSDINNGIILHRENGKIMMYFQFERYGNIQQKNNDNYMRRFFIDMDGVLAKWEPASIEEMTSPGFFLSRVPDPNVLDMVNLLRKRQESEHIEIYILSSYLLDMSKEEKIEWNKRHTHIPEENQIYVPYGQSKTSALEPLGGIQSTDVLLDDFTQNLKEWKGVAVKLYNGINGTHGTWRGFSVHSNMKAEIMVNQLDGISLMESTRLKRREQDVNTSVEVNNKRKCR